MHDQLFARAAIGETPVILRLKMLPYSIGHEIVLTRLQNPLVAATELREEIPLETRYAAVTQAALVCARTWNEQKKTIRWQRIWSWLNNKFCDYKIETDRFHRYRRSAFADMPMAKMPRQKDSVYHYYGAPTIARLLLFSADIYRQFGYQSPYDFPIGLATVLSSTRLEEEGKIWVKNWKDAEDEARLQAFEEKNGNTLSVGKEAVSDSARRWNEQHPDAQLPDWILKIGEN